MAGEIQVLLALIIDFMTLTEIYKTQASGRPREAIIAARERMPETIVGTRFWEALMHIIGDCLIDISDFYGAIHIYTEIVEALPDDSVAWSNRGYCLREAGQLEKALADYDTAITIEVRTSADRCDGILLCKAAELARALGDESRAFSYLSAVLRDFPESKCGRALLGKWLPGKSGNTGETIV